MKIKTKKQMTLPQLIEWAWENDVRNKGFESERNSRIYFDLNCYVSHIPHIEPNDTFTVEVEEEITEDTKFEFLVFIEDFNPKFISPKRNKSINEAGVNTACTIEIHAYIDGEFKCIWRDGKLIEE